MAKRRTRKQKESAKHQFLISWSPSKETGSEAKIGTAEPDVKRQIVIDERTKELKKKMNKYATDSEQSTTLASIRKDITKSLILAGLVIASEVVLYLIL